VRKTKVRIVGDPALVHKIADVLQSFFAFESGPTFYPTAVGRDYSHSDAPGETCYIAVRRERKFKVEMKD
jgi:hypothetical protein